MGLYHKYILPGIIDFVCKQKPTRKQREKIVPLAKGNVLEIGIGTGSNMPFYNPEKVTNLVGIDPESANWKVFINKNLSFGFNVDFIEAFAENMPLDNKSIDTVLVTYTLCSIPEIARAFSEIRRIMKPSGKLIFCEHGKAPDAVIQKWQSRINPIWKRIGGGCNLNLNIPKMITDHGFTFDNLEEMYIPGWKPASYNYWGVASMK